MGDKFYLIKDGTAVCSKTGLNGTINKVTELSSGSYFGEVGFYCRYMDVTERCQPKILLVACSRFPY